MTVVLAFPTDPAHGGPIRPASFSRAVFAPMSRDYPSPLIAFEQSELIPGATYLQFRVGFKALEGEALANMETFLDAMEGKIGRVAYGDPMNLRQGNRGPGGGAPKVQSAGQTGRSLSLYDATPSVTGWLRKADYFSWAEGNYREIHRIAVDADSSPTGEVTLNFNPPIRRPPPLDTPIVTVSPTTTMKFADNTTGATAYSLATVRRGAVVLEMIEAPVQP